MPKTAPRRKVTRDTLNLRIRPDERSLIDRAAALQGKTRTDFVLEAARQVAFNVLAERTLILAEPEAYRRFMTMLDAPAKPNAKLRKALQTKAPWE